MSTVDIPTRLQELANLKDGWLDGEGRALSNDGLVWLADALCSIELPYPHLYPTFSGGVQAEWIIGREDVSLEIDLQFKTGHYDQLNLDTEVTVEEELQLSDQSGWQRLQKLLSVCSGL